MITIIDKYLYNSLSKNKYYCNVINSKLKYVKANGIRNSG